MQFEGFRRSERDANESGFVSGVLTFFASQWK